MNHDDEAAVSENFVVDRALQLELLTLMRDVYPLSKTSFQIGRPVTKEQITSNLHYLSEHGLCDAQISIGMDNHVYLGSARITHGGIDFLADDGGISAILKTITVRLHADTVRELIAISIDRSTMVPEKKSALLAALKKLPENALQVGSKDLIQKGLENIPDIGGWIGSLMG